MNPYPDQLVKGVKVRISTKSGIYDPIEGEVFRCFSEQGQHHLLIKGRCGYDAWLPASDFATGNMNWQHSIAGEPAVIEILA